MKFQAIAEAPENISAGALIRPCYKDKVESDPVLKSLDKETGGMLLRAVKSEEFIGKANQILAVYPSNKIKAEKIILTGIGEKKNSTPDSLRQAIGQAANEDSTKKARKAAVLIDGFEEMASAVVEGFVLGGYENKRYKSNKKPENKNEILVLAVNSPGRIKALEKRIKEGEIIAEGAVMTRNLSSDPSNFLTPEIFASKARELAEKYKFSCQVFDEKRIVREKMGALMSVAKGSDNPPRFLVLTYNGGAKTTAPIVMVGKGITFDSGGISLKPGLNMHEMKQDMTGGAVVFGTFVTSVRLKIRQNIVALIPLAENMPSGRATKPGDIVTSRKGLTIEVINTDAEGRLILADALDYADKFKPQAVIDVATLTGATKYILGYAGAPIIGNNHKLIDALYDSSDYVGERVWELPIWDRHREQMKSPIADLKNSGGPPAGTITAAAFLENFIGDWPWAHIDIAYMDNEIEAQPYIPKGPTGFGMRLLVNLLSNWKKI